MHLGHTLLGNDTWWGYAIQVSALVHNNSDSVHVRKHDELWKAPPAQAVEGRCCWFPHDIAVPASKIDDMTASKNQQKINKKSGTWLETGCRWPGATFGAKNT